MAKGMAIRSLLFLGLTLAGFASILQAQSFHTESAPEWDALFDRDSGWTGADGIYSIPLNGNDGLATAGPSSHTLFLFSDTAIGDVAPDGRRLPGTTLVNNTLALLRGSEPDPERTRLFWKGQHTGTPEAVFVPTTPDAEPTDWYWLMDGIALEERVHVFALRMREGDGGVFNFAIDGVALISMDLSSSDPYGSHVQVDTPFFREATMSHEQFHLGQAIMANTIEAGAPDPDGYIYVYGEQAGTLVKSMVAARVRPERFTDFTAWEYWDGAGWTDTIETVAPITNRISTEFSVTPLPDGRYIAVFQADALGPDVAMRIGESPVGPFGPMHRIYRCPEVDFDPDIYVYNAKAHPHLSEPGELLISYNVNTFDFFGDFFQYADIYRPRFIRLIVDRSLSDLH